MDNTVDIELVVGGDYASKLGEVKAGIAGVGTAADAALAKMRNQLAESSMAVKQVEADLKQMSKQFEKTAPGTDKMVLGQEISAATKALKEEKAIVEELKNKIKEASTANVSFRTEQLQVVETMRRMRQAGQENTAEYDKLKQKLGELNTIMRTTSAEAKQMSTGGSFATGLASGISGITGAFSAAAGAMGVFNTNSEELAKIQTRVQSLMAITIGMQQVANTLHQTSAFRINVVTKAKQAWAAATKFLNVQLGISVGLSKALMVSGIGLLIAGVGLLVSKLSAQREEQEKINKADSTAIAIGKTANQNIAKQVATIDSLRAIMKNENAAYSDKIKALSKLKTIIPDYNADIDKTGRLINENTASVEKYIEALNKQMRVQAAQGALEKQYTKRMDIDLRLKEIQEKEGMDDLMMDLLKNPVDQSDPMFSRYLQMITPNLYNNEDNEKAKEIIAEVKDLFAQQKDVERDIAEINKIIAESPAGLFDKTKESNKEKEAYDASTELQKLLRDINAKTTALQLQLQEDGLQKRLAQIDREKVLELEKIQERNNAIIDAYNKRYNKKLEHVDLSTPAGREKATGTLKIIDNKEAAEQKKAIDTLIDGYIEKNKEAINEFSKQYQSYADKRKEIEKQFDRDIADMRKQNVDGTYNQAIALAQQAKTKELSELDAKFIQETELWDTLFGDLEKISLKKIHSIAAELRKMVMQIADPAIKKQFFDMLDEVEQKAAKSGREIEMMFGNSKGSGILNLFMGNGDFSSRIDQLSTVFNSAKSDAASAASSMGKGAEAAGEMAGNAGEAAGAMGEAGGGAAATIAIVDKIIQTIHKSITSLRDTVNEIVELKREMGEDIDSDSGFVGFVNNLSQFDEKVYSGWEKLKSGDVIGAIGDNVVAYYELFTESKRSAEAARREIEKWQKDEYFAEEEIARLAIERRSIENDINASRLAVIEAEKGLLKGKKSDLETRTQDMIDQIAGQQYVADKETVHHKAKLFDGHWGGYDTVENVMGNLRDYIGDTSDIENVINKLEELHIAGKLNEEQERYREAINKNHDLIMQYAEDERQAEQKIKEARTGTTTDSILDGLKSGLSAGKKAFNDFANDAEDILRNAVMSALTDSFDKTALNKWYEDLATAMDDNVLTDDEKERLKKQYAAIGEEFQSRAQAASELIGDSGNSALTGAVKTITEQSASLIAGQMNAIRVNVVEQMARMDNMLAHVQRIRSTTDEYLPFLQKIDGGITALRSEYAQQQRAA